MSEIVSLPWYSCWEGRSDLQTNTLDLSGHSWNLVPNCTLQDWPQIYMFGNCWKTHWKRVCNCWKTYLDVIFGFIRLRGHCNNRSEVTRLQICCSHSTWLWMTYHAYDGNLPLTIISIAWTSEIWIKSRNPIAENINVKGKHLCKTQEAHKPQRQRLRGPTQKLAAKLLVVRPQDPLFNQHPFLTFQPPTHLGETHWVQGKKKDTASWG